MSGRFIRTPIEKMQSLDQEPLPKPDFFMWAAIKRFFNWLLGSWAAKMIFRPPVWHHKQRGHVLPNLYATTDFEEICALAEKNNQEGRHGTGWGYKTDGLSEIDFQKGLLKTQDGAIVEFFQVAPADLIDENGHLKTEAKIIIEPPSRDRDPRHNLPQQFLRTNDDGFVRVSYAPRGLYLKDFTKEARIAEHYLKKELKLKGAVSIHTLFETLQADPYIKQDEYKNIQIPKGQSRRFKGKVYPIDFKHHRHVISYLEHYRRLLGLPETASIRKIAKEMNKHKKLQEARDLLLDGRAVLQYYLKLGIPQENIVFQCFSMGGSAFHIVSDYQKRHDFFFPIIAIANFKELSKGTATQWVEGFKRKVGWQGHAKTWLRKAIESFIFWVTWFLFIKLGHELSKWEIDVHASYKALKKAGHKHIHLFGIHPAEESMGLPDGTIDFHRAGLPAAVHSPKELEGKLGYVTPCKDSCETGTEAERKRHLLYTHGAPLEELQDRRGVYFNGLVKRQVESCCQRAEQEGQQPPRRGARLHQD